MELGSFFLGQNEKKPILTEPVVITPAGGVPPRVEKGKSVFLGSSRDPRAPDLMTAPITPSVKVGDKFPNSNTRVRMDPTAPRPTRRFGFIWKPKSHTLRIIKNTGEARKAQWHPLRHKAVGLAQNVSQKDPSKDLTQAHTSLDSDVDQPTLKVTNGKETEASSTIDLRAEAAIELPMVTHGGCAPPFESPVGDTAPPSSDGDHFEVGETSGVDYDSESEDSELVRVDLADSTTALGLVMVVPALLGEFSEDATLMLEDSGIVGVENPLPVVNFCSVEDRDSSSPLSCSPLARIDPIECPISVAVDCEVSPGQHSQWVKKHYRGFCTLVGFPMDTHEQECLNLLQRIEADRLKYKCFTRVKQSVGSVKKGARELRNLVSTINYNGRPNGS